MQTSCCHPRGGKGNGAIFYWESGNDGSVGSSQCDSLYSLYWLPRACTLQPTPTTATDHRVSRWPLRIGVARMFAYTFHILYSYCTVPRSRIGRPSRLPLRGVIHFTYNYKLQSIDRESYSKHYRTSCSQTLGKFCNLI